MLRLDDRIVAGVQVLYKAVPWVGRIAYISRGPVVGPYEDATATRLLDQMHGALRTLGVRFCAIQPAEESEALRNALRMRGFEACPLDIMPTATTVVRLEPSEEDLLAAMKAKTRYNVKIGLRSGLEFREADEAGVATFERLLRATAARQGFKPLSVEYLKKFVREFGAAACCKVFLVYAGEEAVAGMLAVGFGDMVSFKRGGWSGAYGEAKPNEFMHWAAIRWARDRGYKYYDFEGIDRGTALDLVAGKKVKLASVSRFKLGFGGDIRLLPSMYETMRPAALFRGYRRFLPVLRRTGLLDRLVSRIRQA